MKCKNDNSMFQKYFWKTWKKYRATEINTETTVNSEKEDMKMSLLAHETYISRKWLQKKNNTDNKSGNRELFVFYFFHYLRYKTN